MTVPPTSSAGAHGVGGPTGGTHVPPAEPLHGAHDTYEKGEVSSIGALVSDITRDFSTLVRQEVQLAKAELQESAKEAGKGAGMFAGAVVAAHLMLIFGSLFVMFLLAELFDSYIWAALVVTVLWAVVAAVLALIGKSSLKNVQGMPRTQETVQKVPAALKGNEN